MLLPWLEIAIWLPTRSYQNNSVQLISVLPELGQKLFQSAKSWESSLEMAIETK